MTRHPVMIAPETLATEAQQIMSENNVRHLPVVGDGKKLLGLITRTRLALKPDVMASLDVWEITRYVSHLTVSKVMLPADKVLTVDPQRTVERAARIMSDHKIGCLPVIDDGVVVGIITEVDLLRSYQDMLGLPAEGVRVTVRMPNKEGQFAKITSVVSKQGWGIMGIGSFPSPRHEGFYDVVLKIPKVTKEEVNAVLSQVDEHEVVDIRDVV
ncbi:MAG: CBS domain-containing protein [Anaerolineae bacterium]